MHTDSSCERLNHLVSFVFFYIRLKNILFYRVILVNIYYCCYKYKQVLIPQQHKKLVAGLEVIIVLALQECVELQVCQFVQILINT